MTETHAKSRWTDGMVKSATRDVANGRNVLEDCFPSLVDDLDGDKEVTGHLASASS